MPLSLEQLTHPLIQVSFMALGIFLPNKCITIYPEISPKGSCVKRLTCKFKDIKEIIGSLRILIGGLKHRWIHQLMVSLARQVSQALENSLADIGHWSLALVDRSHPGSLVSQEVHNHYTLPTMTVSLSTSPQWWGQVFETGAFAIGIKYSLHFVRLAFSDILS